jgi:hypothetical protein
VFVARQPYSIGLGALRLRREKPAGQYADGQFVILKLVLGIKFIVLIKLIEQFVIKLVINQLVRCGG